MITDVTKVNPKNFSLLKRLIAAGCGLDRYLFEFKFESGKSIEFFKFKSSAENLIFSN